MAHITISDLHPVDANFQDSENFLLVLTEQEISNVLGGFNLKLRYEGVNVDV